MLKRKWLIFAVIAVNLTATGVAGAVDNDGSKQADLSLEECFRLAEENNNNIKIAYMGIDKAKISKKKFDKQYDQYDDALKAPRRGNGSPDPFDDPLAPIKEMLTGMFTPSLTTYDTLYSMEVGKVMSELGVDLAEAGYEYVVRQIKLRWRLPIMLLFRLVIMLRFTVQVLRGRKNSLSHLNWSSRWEG